MKRELDPDMIDVPTKRIFHMGEHDDQFHIETRQDVAPVLEDAKFQASHYDERSRWKDINHVAQIPLVIIAEERKKGRDLINDPEALKQWLNDPDNKHFRTRPGRI